MESHAAFTRLFHVPLCIAQRQRRSHETIQNIQSLCGDYVKVGSDVPDNDDEWICKYEKIIEVCLAILTGMVIGYVVFRAKDGKEAESKGKYMKLGG